MIYAFHNRKLGIENDKQKRENLNNRWVSSIFNTFFCRTLIIFSTLIKRQNNVNLRSWHRAILLKPQPQKTIRVNLYCLDRGLSTIDKLSTLNALKVILPDNNVKFKEKKETTTNYLWILLVTYWPLSNPLPLHHRAEDETWHLAYTDRAQGARGK